ncbi:MAG TPA: nucleotide pyrophosphatase/phosphodiesterase family protein [Microbacteriaceae bacterium]|nr:nucleotide pyrophosphatase/phosphodiesterase family protein [Microbacteriaceae bacterium]
MDAMLPVLSPSGPSLAEVMPAGLAALDGDENPLGLPALRSLIVVLVDGLGASLVARHSGHLRFLASRIHGSTIDAVFPSTTAAGISSLCTGLRPGRHGMVGYRVLDPDNDRVVNQLRDWDALMTPEAWQTQRTVFEKAAARGIPVAAVGQSRYRRSGFTRAVLRGARYLGAERLEDRFDAAARFVAEHDRSLVYLYVHELDVAGHAHGCDSLAWCTAAEDVDAALAGLERRGGAGDAVLVTADHGMLDVPPARHVLFDQGPSALLAGVRHVAGEPRCLQLHLEHGSGPAAAERVAEAWREVEGEAAWVATRGQAAEAGWFGPEVTDQAAARLGDVFVAARDRIAFYDSRTASARSRAMVGQHGSLTDEEMTVPLVRLGAAA